MNQTCSFFMKLYFICVTGAVYAGTTTVTAATLVTPGGNPTEPYSWYTDEFGPLQSNYSMGDFVRYTVTPGVNGPINPLPQFKNGKGLNLYYGIADIPYAQDISQYGTNTFNVYNFVGYLFAGYAALHINPSSLTTKNWLSSFRQSGQWMTGSLGFDNNPTAQYTIQLVDFLKRKINFVPASTLGWSTGSLDTGQYLSNARTRQYGTSQLYPLSKANASCSWFADYHRGSYVLAVETPGLSDVNGYAAPYGQMFGARIAHILGAVVNDVPKSTNTVTMMPSNADSPVPQLAIMNGGPYATAAAAPVGITTPSTAHFGSMQNYLTDLASNIAPGLKSSMAYAYLQNHVLPTVSRLATVCSYAISSSSTPSQNNLIEIVSENVTAYDNGVVLAIQNNTGDVLQVNQVTSAGKNAIGKLKRGVNNHFLHTASLMDGATAATASAQVDPVATNMIEIQDLAAKANVYVQVLSADQFEALQTAFNTALGTVSGSSVNVFSYNQGNTYTEQNDAQYLVVTNFNPATIATTTATIDQVLMYRIQAINLTEFHGQPYFVTFHIDRENVGNGLQNNQMVVNQQGPAILYPSIVSVKTCLWKNPYDRARGAGFYSSIPLLLIPDIILSSGITGLAAHYGIWLMSYAAALTEFQFGCEFGNTMNCLRNTFQLFDDTSENMSARVVIDAAGVLSSGQSLKIKDGNIIGSDVFDIGNNFHQDIPVLNLYQSGTSVVANQVGGDYINFTVNFDVVMPQNFAGMTPSEILTLKIKQAQTIKNVKDREKAVNLLVENFAAEEKNQPQVVNFSDVYQAPYSNMMLFSLQTSDLQAGVHATLSQSKAGNYQLEFADDADNVLAVQKILISEIDKNPTVHFNFLNDNDAAWSDSAIVPQNIMAQVAVGKDVSFILKVATGTVNKFIIQPLAKSKMTGSKIAKKLKK